MPCLPAPRGYSLLYTLLPSFTLPLFRVDGETAVKLYGWRAGATIWVDDGIVCCEGCGAEELMAWSGLWVVTRSEKLGVVIGLSVSPWDDRLLLPSIVASQNTSWWRVVSWMRRLLPLLEGGMLEEAEDVAAQLGSYQARHAVRAYEAYTSLRLHIAMLGVWEARRLLLDRLPYAGVKTVDALILFSTHAGYPIPVDRHVLRAVGGSKPEPRYCKRYRCTECPLRERCAAWRMFKLYGWRAGVHQVRVWLEAQPRWRLERLAAVASA